MCLVVNQTRDQKITLPSTPFSLKVIYRENLGMNIGAWDYGWRACPEHPYYLFLQDECYAIRANWLTAFCRGVDENGVGLVGESLNQFWDRRWDDLLPVQNNSFLSDHFINGQPATRVDAYFDFFKRHAIPVGESARHLRSLLWCFRNDILKKIDGFPIGLNFGECIASEISVNLKIQALNLQVVEVGPQPFHYFRHFEYNQAYPGGAFMKSTASMAEMPGRSIPIFDSDREADRMLQALNEAERKCGREYKNDNEKVIKLVAVQTELIRNRERKIKGLENRIFELERELGSPTKRLRRRDDLVTLLKNKISKTLHRR